VGNVKATVARLSAAGGVAAALLIACGNPVAWQGAPSTGADSLVNYYRTPHFVFFYDTSVYRRSEVVANGKAKEAHLKRITSELAVSFDKEIMVRLISASGDNWSGQAYPREPYFIQEDRDYFVSDNGHEIVHIVSFETMGFPNNRFFVEGLAAAHELSDQPKWTRLCFGFSDSSQVAEALARVFDVTTSPEVNYALAGAYVEWLEQKFGIETFKAFYVALGTFDYSSTASLCERYFGMEVESLHAAFIKERFNMALGSRYCGGY
jgi:hypothetical protein